jgi:hypothetical protein
MVFQGELLNFFLGGFLLFVMGIIPVSGPVVVGIAGLLGLGAIMLRAQALRRQKQPA